MKKLILIMTVLTAVCVQAAGLNLNTDLLKIKANYIAADNYTQAFTATGGVVATLSPLRLLSEEVHKTTNNVTRFKAPTLVTTCTNRLDSLHWSLDGEVEYAEGRYVLGRDMTLRSYMKPLFWVPYWMYPLDTDSGLRVMAGYTGRWGAYIMTKYLYGIIGNPSQDAYALWGNTRFDLRFENGVALGQTLSWQLGDFGRGHFKVYYAWDQDADDYDHYAHSYYYNYANWGSKVPDNRYIVELAHRWEASERDTVRLQGVLTSDSHIQNDFFSTSFLTIRNQFGTPSDNELAWEHLEDAWGAGLSVAGPLNNFYQGTLSLPELYLDLAPTPVFGLPINYETENRIGYLGRRAAHYSKATDPTFAYTPGRWADYYTFRFDTYHRLTAPFKVADVLSVVPRVGYRGTYWGDTGTENLTGLGGAGKMGSGAFRSIFESGVTFAARGKAWIDDEWQSVIEPYADVLAQKAVYSGLKRNARPFVFDNLDYSSDWSDQFAGRARNLPYTYVGVTPGFRKLLRRLDDRGQMRTVFDLDVYAALELGRSSWTEGDGYHRLARKGRANYGENACSIYPGVRMRWFPTEDSQLSALTEYDSDNNKMALASIRWAHKLSKTFTYDVSYNERNHRYWDFSSTPTAGQSRHIEDLNWPRFSYVHAGFEQEICDAVAWGPYINWDCRRGELDTIGSWIDLRTDCLGFRFMMAYRTDYYRVDGSKYDHDVDIGFYIYLRAFGADSGNIMNF